MSENAQNEGLLLEQYSTKVPDIHFPLFPYQEENTLF